MRYSRRAMRESCQRRVSQGRLPGCARIHRNTKLQKMVSLLSGDILDFTSRCCLDEDAQRTQESRLPIGKVKFPILARAGGDGFGNGKRVIVEFLIFPQGTSFHERIDKTA